MKHQLNKAGKDQLRTVLLTIWSQRELVLALSKRDIKLKYQQTILGVLWLFLNPLLMASIFTFFFSQIIHFKQVGNSTLFVLTAYLGWYIFANTLQQSSQVWKESAAIVEKIQIHRLILVMARCISISLEHFVFILLVLIFTGISGQLSFHFLCWLPLGYALSTFSALGVTFFVAGISMTKRDVIQLVPHFLQIGIWLTPVFYAKEMLPEKFQLIFSLNPLVGMTDFWRFAIYGLPIDPWHVFICFVVLLLFGWISLRFFVKRERIYLEQV